MMNTEARSLEQLREDLSDMRFGKYDKIWIRSHTITDLKKEIENLERRLNWSREISKSLNIKIQKLEQDCINLRGKKDHLKRDIKGYLQSKLDACFCDDVGQYPLCEQCRVIRKLLGEV